jgi:hypothetical protein
MTAIVSQERAKATWLTGAAGLLLLMAAFVMMIASAPAHLDHRAHGPVKPSAVQLTADPCHQFTSRSDSTAVRACLVGPPVPSARAEAYTPPMTGDSWSAGRSGRDAPPQQARSSVS